MRLFELARFAVKSIALHKLRSFLTTLGITFGVAAVISMICINEATRIETLQQIETLGTNNIRIKSVKPVIKKEGQTGRRGWVINYGISSEDTRHIKETFGDVSSVIMVKDIREKVYAGGKKLDVKVFAVSPEFFVINNLRLDSGRFLCSTDDEEKKLVCVLGSEAKQKFFGRRHALGKVVNIAHRYYEVVGILKDRAASPAGITVAGDINNYIFIPFSTHLSRAGNLSVSREEGAFEAVRLDMDELIVTVPETDKVLPIGSAIKSYFSRTHPMQDYEIVIPLELIRQREQMQIRFTLVMISIAAISLLVGGIGIMNIMLANVVERTKEIGTRRALGASRRDILIQFLMESVILSLAGGVIGIGVGIGLTFLISAVFEWKFVITWVIVILPFIISVMVGIIFGTYPARKAAYLDPIEALRAE